MFCYVTSDELGGIFHVGTLDITRKSDQSLEWNGLSVSNCPEAWKQICGCCGTTWRMVSNHADRFLLFHELDEGDLDAVRSWAIEKGYFKPAKEYQVSWYDEEYDDIRFFTFAENEYEQARCEYEFKVDEDEQVSFTEVINGIYPTVALESMSMVRLEPGLYMDVAVILYAEYALGCDGVWWDDTYDPYGLSAPRGVIVNSALGGFDAVDDEAFS